MITDAIIGVAHAAVEFLVGLLPLAPERPVWLDGMFQIAYTADYLLPMSEIVAFFPTMVIVWGALLVWRFVRSLLPGG